MADINAQVQDPFRRKLLEIAGQANAESGQVNTDVPNVDVPSQFDVDPQATGIRESILRGVRGEFLEDLNLVQERAQQAGRLRAGSTSQRELDAARAAQDKRVARLGQFEAGEREGIRNLIGQQAAIETTGIENRRTVQTRGIENRLTINAQGQIDITNIRERGEQDRKTTAVRGEIERDLANINARTQKEIAAGEVQFDPTIDDAREYIGDFTDDALRDIFGLRPDANIDREELSNFVFQNMPHLIPSSKETVASRQQRAAESQGETALDIEQQKVNLTRGEIVGFIGPDLNAEQMDALFDAENAPIEEIAARLGIPADRIDVLGEDEIRKTYRDRISDQLGIPKETILTLEARTRGKELSISDRLAAVQEGRLSLDEFATHTTLAMQDDAQKFGQKVTRAEILGIWHEYGPEEYSDFQDTYNLGKGQEGFNDRYDFNGDGLVDFQDFKTFSRLSQTGVDTLSAKALMEDTRQFDLTLTETRTQRVSGQGLQWMMMLEQIEATAEQNGLDRQQTKDLAITTLLANVSIAESQLGLQELQILAEAATGPLGLAMLKEEREAFIDRVFGSSILRDNFGTAVIEIDAFIDEVEAGMLGQGPFVSLFADDMSPEQAIDLAIRHFDNMPDFMKGPVLEMMDFNGDGKVDETDRSLLEGLT